MQSDIGSPSSESFLSAQPTESIHTVVEVYVYDRFTEFDRTLDDSASVIRGTVTDGETSTVEPLQIAQLEDTS